VDHQIDSVLSHIGVSAYFCCFTEVAEELPDGCTADDDDTDDKDDASSDDDDDDDDESGGKEVHNYLIITLTIYHSSVSHFRLIIQPIRATNWFPLDCLHGIWTQAGLTTFVF